MELQFDDLESKKGFFVTKKPDKPTFLPEPERRRRRFTLISVDDHLVEPPNMFTGRVPGRFAELAPRVELDEKGMEYWLYDGKRQYKVGLNAVVGRPIEERSFEPARFDEMRLGAYDIAARVHDMDLNGVYASLNFPSSLAGFAGQRYQLGISDPGLALAVVQAANDWHAEEWAGRFPDRIIPLQLPWLLDPEVGAAEIRRNAARGFRAVTFPELPERLGLPSLHTGYWDPFMAACEETETVICLHVGSSSSAPMTSSDAPSDTIGVLFFVASNPVTDATMATLMALALLSLLAGGIVGIYGPRVVTAKQIDDRYAWIGGVSSQLLDTLPDWPGPKYHG